MKVSFATRAVLPAMVVFAVVYLALDFNKLYALRYGADTGTFLQFLANEAHGRGSWNNAEYRAHLQVHDSWTLLALVPLIAVAPYAQTLLVVQVVAIAGAAWFIYLFARRCGAGDATAAIAAIAYLISPSAQGLAYGDFAENSLVPLVAAAGVYAVSRRAIVAALICAQILLGLKEDQALLLAWFGAACAIWWDRRIGVGIVALAVANGAAFVFYESMVRAQPSIPQYALHVDHPLGKLAFFAALLVPFAFAPLWLRWRVLLGAPLIAELLFNRPWAYEIARIGTHWTASITIAVALASAYVLAKHPRLRGPVIALAIVAALTINDTVLKIGRYPYIVDWNAYRRAAALRTSRTPVTILRHEEGVYAAAAANPYVRLARYVRGERGYCPSYNTNARAYFASLGMTSWPSGVRLCEGVAVR